MREASRRRRCIPERQVASLNIKFQLNESHSWQAITACAQSSTTPPSQMTFTQPGISFDVQRAVLPETFPRNSKWGTWNDARGELSCFSSFPSHFPFSLLLSLAAKCLAISSHPPASVIRTTTWRQSTAEDRLDLSVVVFRDTCEKVHHVRKVCCCCCLSCNKDSKGFYRPDLLLCICDHVIQLIMQAFVKIIISWMHKHLNQSLISRLLIADAIELLRKSRSLCVLIFQNRLLQFKSFLSF